MRPGAIVLYILILIGINGAKSILIESSSREVVLRFEIARLDTYQLKYQGKLFTTFHIPDARLTDVPGQPAIPYWETRVVIPGSQKPRVSAQVVQQSSQNGVLLLPAYYSHLKKNSPDELLLDAGVYQQSTPFPENIVAVSEPYMYRGVWVVRLRVFPIRYLPTASSVEIFHQLIVRLTFPREKSFARIAPFTEQKIQADPILAAKVVNPQQIPNAIAEVPRAFRKASVNYDFTTGNWYKFPVKEEGIYRITGRFLKNSGIDISQIQVATIQMFNYGGWRLPWSVSKPRPRDLNEIAIQVNDFDGDGILDENDEILFYGRGVLGWRYDGDKKKWVSYLHPYSTTNYYLFTYNAAIGKRIPETASLNDPGAIPLTRFTDRRRFEEDRYNILGTGLDWYWERLEGFSDIKEIEFSLPQHVEDGDIRFYVIFKGENGFIYGDNGAYLDSISIFVNNVKIIDNYTLYRTEKKGKVYTASQLAPFRGGSNTLRIQMVGNDERSKVLLDYFTLEFPRQLIAENNQLKFNVTFTGTPFRYNIDGFSDGKNTVWDITDFANVKAITPLQNGTQVVFEDSGSVGAVKEYYVFNASTIRNINAIEPVSSRPNLRDPSRKGKFIIILPEEFYDVAGQLEDLRESDPLDPIETERVILSDIYREFSSGVLDVTAIRDFLMYAYYNWAVPPEYVLLFGDGSYDYRHIELKDYINRVPTYQIEDVNEIFSRESDHFYTAFGNTAGNNRNLDPWLPIGRFPVNSVEEAQTYLEKLKNYPQFFREYPDYNGWQITLTFAADDEFGPPGSDNEWFHLNDTEDLVKNYVNKLGKFAVRKIYLTDYEPEPGGIGRVKPKATEDLMNQINQGTLIVNYFGHGDPQTWAHEWLLVRSRDLNKFQNSGRLPFYVAATCDWGKFDNPNETSMAEEMFWGDNRGGIAVLSSSRPVFASSNAAFVKAFFYYLFNNLNGKLPSVRLGDALVASLGGGSNDQKFRLLGDPTMRLDDPKLRMKITAITPDTLKALSVATITAEVVDENNNPIPNFNGQAVIWVTDAKIDRKTKNGVYNYSYPGATIFKGRVNVNNGQLTARFVIPRSIQYKMEASGEVHIYAWDGNGQTAVGFYNKLILTGSASGVEDTEGPLIDFTFEDQPDFTNGDYVSRQPTLIVRLYDENGINLTGETGHRIELIINDRIRKDVTSFFVYKENDFREGSLRYTLPPLPPGTYSVKIRAWDNLNNPSEAEVVFKTASNDQLVLEEVANYPNPFQNETYFTFQFQSPSGGGDVTIKIYTLNGRLIQTIRDFATPGFNKIYWDGRDADGAPIANGVYLYKIIVNDGKQQIDKIEKLVILR